MNSGHVGNDAEALKRIHRRWSARRVRSPASPDFQDIWVSEQCGGCRYWFPLAGKLGLDYGACANSESEFDSHVKFEHDGCDFFEPAGEWVVSEDLD
ncbi:DUF3027 domain-containing protein [Nocardiopsis sp. CC223A]|uniref:DUF3027 domain-containing protein n=1 Tax=Nocardiopsis sp. CC223A TaxID=3044051 RepID=UPI003556FA5E